MRNVTFVRVIEFKSRVGRVIIGRVILSFGLLADRPLNASFSVISFCQQVLKGGVQEFIAKFKTHVHMHSILPCTMMQNHICDPLTIP